jgi:hypothetical protein
MSRYSPAKRAKELRRKAKHEAKEARKKERHENPGTPGTDDDIDWSQAVGMPKPEGAEGEAGEGAEGDATESATEEGDQ